MYAGLAVLFTVYFALSVLSPLFRAALLQRSPYVFSHGGPLKLFTDVSLNERCLPIH